ncbi:MAG: hypothetical protein ABI898_04880 [Sphingomonadales bacterium]
MPESPAPPLHIPFDPVPVAARHDGWTPDKQRGFIDALALCGCVSAAARHVGMTPRSAWRLRERADATGFAAAWDKALTEGRRRTLEIAIPRAIYGERIPVFYGGRQIGEKVRYDNRLAIAVLNRHAAELARRASSPPDLGSTEFPWNVV